MKFLTTKKKKKKTEKKTGKTGKRVSMWMCKSIHNQMHNASRERLFLTL